jgi:formate transporter
MSEIFGFDAFSPKEIASRVETIGVAKARLPLLSMLMLSVLAGAFIGLGALYFVLVRSDPSLGFAAGQVLGGVAFSLGLILVVVAGAELFTGNNLLAMPGPTASSRLSMCCATGRLFASAILSALPDWRCWCFCPVILK